MLTEKKGKAAPIFVGDPAFVDKVIWTRMVLEGCCARFITRTKSNMKPMIYSSYGWDRKNPVNEGVEADLSVCFNGATIMRIIRYRDPESGVGYEFLTSVMDLEAGLIALLYLTRWRIEKLFDTTKNMLEETKTRLRQFSGSFLVKTELSLGFLGSKILVRAICSAKF